MIINSLIPNEPMHTKEKEVTKMNRDELERLSIKELKDLMTLTNAIIKEKVNREQEELIQKFKELWADLEANDIDIYFDGELIDISFVDFNY